MSAALKHHYDPSDYRIRNGSKLHHLEGEHLEATYSSTGQLQNKNLRGVVVDEIVNGYTYHSSNANDWTNYTFHHDHLNSVTALTGHNGSTEETAKYDAFGQPLSLTIPGTGNDLLYTGREYDRGTGLYYYRARYYDPEIGRFTSEDPLGFEAGVNFYAYVGNNPLNANDPSGLRTLIVHGTFARDAIWDNPGSSFNTAVSNTFGEAAQQFQWDGANTKSARTTGASNLLNWLRNNPLKPGEALNIVAHSHGGNLIKEFTNLPGAPKITTLVTLGTPQRSDYQVNAGNVGNHINVSAWNDAVQANGGPWWTLGGAGAVDGRAGQNIFLHPDTFNPIQAHSNLYTSSVWSDITSRAGLQNGSGGGFVLYPNRPNTNFLQSVYTK
jgi:RHS repeat-associated protein